MFICHILYSLPVATYSFLFFLFFFFFFIILCNKKIIILLYLKKPLCSSFSLVNDIQRVFILSKSIVTPPQFLPRANRKMHLWRIHGDVNFYYAFFYAIRYIKRCKKYTQVFVFLLLSSHFFRLKKITAGKSAGTCVLNRILHRCQCESCWSGQVIVLVYNNIDA